MGVYIKGMEMPTDCTECWFRKTARHEYLADCQICPFTGDTTPYTKRKDNCPLVPVPPHGRLIAEDDAIKTAWMILRGIGYFKEENPQLEQTVREVFATAPAIEVK